jgi:hypothetical protein
MSVVWLYAERLEFTGRGLMSMLECLCDVVFSWYA